MFMQVYRECMVCSVYVRIFLHSDMHRLLKQKVTHTQELFLNSRTLLVQKSVG